MTFNHFHWVKPVSPARGMGIAWFVLFGSLFITVWVWHLTRADNERLARERFEHQVIQIQSEISDRLSIYEQVLRGFVSFLNGSEEVTRQEWRRYYDNLKIEQNYPSIQGIGFVRHILPADKDALIQQICAEGFPDFTVWPAGERSEYTSIVYIEPFDWRNRRAFGYDMFSEPVRRAAMEQARDTGRTAVSGKITPVQETDQDVQAEFLVYLPVYQRNRPLETVEQRRVALLGYVYGSFRMNDLMRGILGRITPADIHLEIFDGKEISERTRLYDSDPLTPVQESKHFTLRTELDVGGHSWTLLVSAQPGFTAVYQGLSPLTVLLVGVLASLLLFLITWSLTTTRQRTLALANRMTTAIKESETRLREITATLEKGVYVQDSEGRITFVNPEAQKLLGWSLEELIGQEAHSLFHEHTGNTTFPGGVCPLLQSVRAGASFRSEDDTFRRRDGTTLAVAVVASPIRRQGQHAGAVVAFRDITERKQAEAVRRDNQRFRALFEYSREALFLLDTSGRIIDVNRLTCESLGYMRATLLHVSFPVVVGNLRMAGVAVSLAQIIEHVRQHESVVVEAEFSRQDGRSTSVESLFSLIDHEGRHLVLAAVRDITERKQAEIGWKQALTELEQAKLEMERINQRLIEANLELQRISQQDGLTGIANRRYFDEYLVREWRRASRSAQTLALILADVDHFKAYNDCYGHQAGDDCLRRIAEVLSAEVRRPADLLARYGGEEVVAALPDTSLEGALQIAENMRIAVEVLAIPHAKSATAPHVTLSLGVAAVVPRPDILPRWLVGTADKALYQAKAEGRNRVCVGEGYKGGWDSIQEGADQVYTDSMNQQQRRELFTRLQAANPQPTTELKHMTPFELLIAVILSAQATDKSVNEATARLFAAANTPQAILALGVANLKDYIKTIGLYNSKAANIIKTCTLLLERHNGQVPRDRAALEALPGVGRKTANVILNTAFGEPTIAVDTHIFRVANRTGLAPGKTVLLVEHKLLDVVPEEFKRHAHHWLVLHGRYICTARKPHCGDCIIRDLCEYPDKSES